MRTLKDINGSTRLAAVIGSPISHSLSPLIYNVNFEEHQVNSVYVAFETPEEETVSRIESLKNIGVMAINITMPGKFQALLCCDRLAKAASYVQAINTMVQQEGEWVGYNTDGQGFWQAVKARDVTIEGSQITLYGTGSTTRIILAQAVIEGSKHINIIGRNLDRPLEIKIVIQRLVADYPDLEINLIDIHDSEGVKEAVQEADILVQTTNVGMKPKQDATLLEEAQWLNPDTIVCDIVYNPRETAFIQQAKSQNCTTIGGIDMLVNQAAINYKIMTGLEMNIEKTLSLMPIT